MIFENELKPCPLCGGEARELVWTENEGDMFAVGCPSCKMQSYRKADAGKAVAAWNALPRPAEKLAACRELVDALTEAAKMTEGIAMTHSCFDREAYGELCEKIARLREEAS